MKVNRAKYVSITHYDNVHRNYDIQYICATYLLWSSRVAWTFDMTIHIIYTKVPIYGTRLYNVGHLPFYSPNFRGPTVQCSQTAMAGYNLTLIMVNRSKSCCLRHTTGSNASTVTSTRAIAACAYTHTYVREGYIMRVHDTYIILLYVIMYSSPVKDC